MLTLALFGDQWRKSVAFVSFGQIWVTGWGMGLAILSALLCIGTAVATGIELYPCPGQVVQDIHPVATADHSAAAASNAEPPPYYTVSKSN